MDKEFVVSIYVLGRFSVLQFPKDFPVDLIDAELKKMRPKLPKNISFSRTDREVRFKGTLETTNSALLRRGKELIAALGGTARSVPPPRDIGNR